MRMLSPLLLKHTAKYHSDQLFICNSIKRPKRVDFSEVPRFPNCSRNITIFHRGMKKTPLISQYFKTLEITHLENFN